MWPFETLKNQAQAGTLKGASMLQSARAIGLLGLYRGIGPGSVSVFLRNGVAMVVMTKAKAKLAEHGVKA